jgi:hypothetical protein
MKRFFALGLALSLLVLGGARAQGPDDEYVQIYSVIQEADALNSGGSLSQAMAKYLEAQAALQHFQKSYPDWNPRIFSYRVSYVKDKIAALSAKVPLPPAPLAATTNRPPGARPEPDVVQPVAPLPSQEVTALRNQLGALETQVRGMQADKQLLEAKLKEALAAQPAAMDPRELARAEERVKNLEKENDLLKVGLAQEKAKATPGAGEAKSLAETQQALTEANKKLAEQTQKFNGLAQEKKFLEAKLAQLAPTPDNASALESAKKALAEANRQLAAQKDLAAKLTAEKDALQSRLKNPSSDSDTVAALRAENALLKKQAAEAKTAAGSGSKSSLSRKLAEARAELAALESERDILRVEKLALANRLKQRDASAPGANAAAATTVPVLTNTVVVTQTVTVTNIVERTASKAEVSARLKTLERERDDLQKKLNAATKELNHRKSQATAARVSELEGQLAGLKTRLEVYEARQVPFTAEELAVFNKPAPQPAEPAAAPAAKPAHRMSAETIALVRDAQHYFANHQLDKAEDAYTQVLRKDQDNVVALANLATIQMENNHLQAAETNILQALARASDDAYSLSILGYLRYRQHQYDAALDALGRAAKLDPQNAQVQNYLGITLAEKGLRGPAETAFRKAIQIEPNYSDAHVNLALIYVAQQPPAFELARWHYQRALTAGHAREPYLEKTLEVKK